MNSIRYRDTGVCPFMVCVLFELDLLRFKLISLSMPFCSEDVLF